MNLHRSTQPDWAKISPANRNNWQRLAAATHGIVTPGNIMTLLGLVIVLFGLQQLFSHHYWMCFWLVGIGRFCDIADGWLADTTRTKSPLGEIVDAAADKIIGLVTIIVLYYLEIVPLWIVGILVIPQYLIAIFSLQALHYKDRLHPSLSGKLSVVLIWLGLLGFIVVQAIPTFPHGTLVPSAVMVCSAILSIYASFGYLKKLQN